MSWLSTKEIASRHQKAQSPVATVPRMHYPLFVVNFRGSLHLPHPCKPLQQTLSTTMYCSIRNARRSDPL